MTIEQQIITFLENQLATILIANGYNTSAGFRVYKNQQYTVNEQERPLLILFPGKNLTTFDGAPNGMQLHFFEIGIEGVVDDNERGEETDKLRQDMAKLLWSDCTFGGQVYGVPEGITLDSRVENSGEFGFIGYVHAGFTVLYRTPIGGL